MTEKPVTPLADLIRQAESTRKGLLLESKDADISSVYYPITLGAGLRRRLGLRGKQARWFGGALIVYIYLAAWIGASMHGHVPTSILSVVLAGIGWLLCCVATVLSPDDFIYINRLSCMIPGRNPLQPQKLLWSKLEEIVIVDRSKDNSGDFALRLAETSGMEHQIYLRLLSKEGLDKLSGYIRKYAPHTRGIAQLNEIDRFLEYQQGNAARISYTQLWESACTAQFGLTSFTPLAPGVRVQETFAVKRQIAAGGFSAIYLIEDDEHNQFVLKESVLPPGMDETARAKATEHFQREAHILARIEHKQVARVFDHFVENGRSYLRMEYIEGISLRAHIRDGGAQDELLVTNWISQLAKILEYLHSMTPPVVHRDLTPDNIMIRPNGELALIDFGAANEFIGSATGTLIGKHAYMAPEQIQGCAEPASDIYSLGAVAYFCVCGRDPEPIRTASPLRDEAAVSEHFDRFVQACMNLSKEARLKSGDECLAMLKEALKAN